MKTVVWDKSFKRAFKRTVRKNPKLFDFMQNSDFTDVNRAARLGNVVKTTQTMTRLLTTLI